MSKLQGAVALLVAAGLLGVGTTALSRNGPTPAVLAAERDVSGKLGPAPALPDKGRAEAEADRRRVAEAKLTEKLVEARLRLMELEERLNEANAEGSPAQAEADRLRQAEAETEAALANAKRALAETAPRPPALVRLEEQLAELRARRARAEDLAAVARERRLKGRIDLRRQMVRLVEEVRLLERQREDAGAPSGAGELRGLERQLSALRGEVAEQRREVRALRAALKKGASR
jgi:colicin import membrane protein